MRIILANGCFDLLHPGHVEHLREARAMGTSLVVGLTADEHVNKPGRPIQSWDERAAMLKSLRCVTRVIKCKDAVHAIFLVQPHVFVKGADYQKVLPEEARACDAIGAEIRFTKAVKRSTTELIKRIRETA